MIWVPDPSADWPNRGHHEPVELDGLGDYSEGRWVWELSNVEPLSEPIPARGYQGLWTPRDVNMAASIR